MNNINGIPLLWDHEEEERLFGGLFQGLGTFSEINSNPNIFKSPLSEKYRPSDGSFLKLDKALSVFTDDFSYTITVNKYASGLEVLKNYYDSSPETNEIIFFCETTNTEKSNMFGTFALVKYGENYKKLLNDLIQKNTPGINSRRKDSNVALRIENYDDEVLDNFNILTKNFSIDIDHEKVRLVMDNELQFTSNRYKTVADLFGWYNKSITFIVEAVNQWLEELKFKEKDYLPPAKKENQSGELTILIDYSIPEVLQKFVTNTLENALAQIKQYAKENFPPSWIAFLKKAYNTIKAILIIFKKGVEFLKELGHESFYVGRAFLMGITNGLINTVQTILSLIGWMLKTNADEKLTGENYRKFQEKLEFIEDFIDLVYQNANDIYIAIENLVNNFSIEKVKNTLSVFTQEFKNISIYDCAYMAGLFIFEVVVGVILSVFTGGVSLFAEAANTTEKIAALLKLFVQEAIATATFGVLEILNLFKILITKFALACQKGWKGFKRFLENLFKNKIDDVAKSEGKVLDERLIQFNSIADPVADILGPAYKSHPERYDEIVNFLKSNKVEIIFKDREVMAYSPLRKGEPGQLIIYKEASISSWEHELTHYLDDEEAGFLGAASLYDANYRVTTELNAYRKEIEFVKQLNGQNLDVIEQLKINFKEELKVIEEVTNQKITDKELLNNIEQLFKL